MQHRRLAHYELTSRLGAGAMGEVWQATDTTLGRQVAVKILPEEFQASPERLARFEREAKLLASLNHPNIATIHGLHTDEGVRFLALELVTGEDLAERLARGPIPIDETLGLALQIASALRAAHAAGVIHRDLKPANIRITDEGKVRVLDFGLAKALDPTAASGSAPGVAPAGSGGAAAPTLTSTGTVAGVILGTAAYMSPEQARAKPVDQRTDLWAFGCVLYEMLTGRPPFEGETISDVLAAILRGEPDWSALPAETPRSVRRLLRRCLQKEPDRRLHDIGDARLEIEDARDPALAAEGAVPATPARATRTPWILTVLFALAAISLLIVLVAGREARRSAVGPAGLHLSLNLSPDLVLMPGNVGGQRLAVAPDGSRVAFTARDEDTVRLYLRELSSDRVVEVPETRGASNPFFSADGLWVGFFSSGKLKKVAVSGGTPIAITDAPTTRGGVWLEDDTIVYAPAFDSGFLRVSAAGGEPQPVTTPDREANERTHRWPGRLPGDRAVLFTIGTLDKPGAYDDAVIAAVELDGGRITQLIEGGSMARYVNGHLVYARQGNLLAVPFDPDALRIVGAPVTVLEGVASELTSGAVDFAFTDDGTMAFVPAVAEIEPELVQVDRDGRSETLPFNGRAVLTPRLSPDGRRLAVTIGRGVGDGDLWIYDLQQQRNTRVTFHNSGAQPVWSLDGRDLIYGFTRGGEEGVASQPVDGSGELRRILPWVGSEVLFPDSWHAPTETLLLSVYGGKGECDIAAYTVGATDLRPVVEGDYSEGAAALSPQGDWFAYVSDESGRFEIYVRPYPGPGGKFQISVDGGKGPIWSRTGDEIFYSDGDRLMAVPVRTEPTFSAGEPRELFRITMRRDLGPWPDYEVSPDGKTFYLFRRSPETIEPRQVDVRFGFAGSFGGAG